MKTQSRKVIGNLYLYSSGAARGVNTLNSLQIVYNCGEDTRADYGEL